MSCMRRRRLFVRFTALTMLFMDETPVSLWVVQVVAAVVVSVVSGGSEDDDDLKQAISCCISTWPDLIGSLSLTKLFEEQIRDEGEEHNKGRWSWTSTQEVFVSQQGKTGSEMLFVSTEPIP